MSQPLYAHTYDDLLALADAAEVYTSDSDTSQLTTPHKLVLKELGILVLGELEGTSKIIAFSEALKKNVTIPAIDRMKMANVIQWFGEEMEDLVWPGGGIDTMPPGCLCTLNQLRNAIAAEGGKTQLNLGNLKGGGAWEVNGRILLVGDHELATYNGSFKHSVVPVIEDSMIDFGSCEKWYDYEKLEHYLTQSKSQEWRIGVLNDLFDLFNRWDNWQNLYDGELCASLVLCTWLQTIWEWRPCIFVTGPTNSGKSMLLEETLPKLFGKLTIFSQKSTMAGLMQAIGQTAKVAILDEFESGKERKIILELVRTSGRGGKTLRGTPSQDGKRYGLRHVLWMGAIETGLSDAADRNRFILLHLDRVVKQKGDTMLQLPSDDDLEDLGMKSLAVAISCWKQVKERAKVLHESVIGGVDHRIVESYSLPCAMIGVILGQNAEENAGTMRTILEGRDLVGQQVSDEQRLLEEIFESVVFMGGGKQCTVSQAVLSASGTPEEREAVERCGVKSYPDKQTGEDMVFLSPRPVSRHLLKDSDFRWKQIDEILARVKGARRTQVRLSGKRPYGRGIPRSEVIAMLGEEYEQEEMGVQPQATNNTSAENQGSFF